MNRWQDCHKRENHNIYKRPEFIKISLRINYYHNVKIAREKAGK